MNSNIFSKNFWALFEEIIKKKEYPFKIFPRNQYASINSLSTVAGPMMGVLTKDRVFRVGIYISDDTRTPCYQKLLDAREEIENIIGADVSWLCTGKNHNTKRIQTEIYYLIQDWDESYFSEFIESVIPLILRYIHVAETYIPKKITKEYRDYSSGNYTKKSYNDNDVIDIYNNFSDENKVFFVKQWLDDVYGIKLSDVEKIKEYGSDSSEIYSMKELDADLIKEDEEDELSAIENRLFDIDLYEKGEFDDVGTTISEFDSLAQNNDDFTLNIFDDLDEVILDDEPDENPLDDEPDKDDVFVIYQNHGKSEINDLSNLVIGMRVQHKYYGYGTLTNVDFAKDEVSVKFDKGWLFKFEMIKEFLIKKTIKIIDE